MKKLAMTLGMFITTAVYAAPNDISAVLAINGTVQNANGGCTVTLDRDYMKLDTQDIKDIPVQGHYKDTVSGNINVARMTGDNCKSISGGSIALKFTGTADSAMGNSFENTSSGIGAAQGIGVSVYGYGKNVITPNTSDVPTMNNEYPFYVGVVKLADSTPTPGLVQSTITVEVNRL